MAFFRNDAVNLLNLHYAIHSVALGGGAAFFVAYLLKSGVSAPLVFLAVAFILLGRLVIRPVVIGLAARCGLRAMVVVGTLVVALQYPLLAEVRGPGLTLVALCVVASVGDTIYWSTYHAYFAALGDDQHRGQQIGVREAIAAIVGVASPLAIGATLVGAGPRVTFDATAVIVAASALPLLWTPDVPVARHLRGGFGAAIQGALLFAADGWIAASYVFVWQVALFLSLDQSLLAFGGALAAAAFVGAIGGMVLGRHIDAGHGKRAVAWACGVVAVIIVLRAVATGNAAAAVLANALGALGGCLYVPTLMTAIYTQAKRSPCTLRFHVVTEGGWDLGGASGLLGAALMTALGVPLALSLLPALAGVGAIAIVLRRYYAGGDRAPAIGRLPAE